MKHTRRLLTLCGLATALAGAGEAYAQDRHGRHGDSFGPDPARLIERMARHLDLDETQEVQIQNILEAARPEFDALKEEGRETRTAMRALTPEDADYSAKLNDLAVRSGQLVTEGALLFGRVRAEVHAVLTPEQVAELAELMERRGGWSRGRRGR